MACTREATAIRHLSKGSCPILAKGGNRAVAWVVARCVWGIVSHAAARAVERDCVGCHVN